MAVQVLQFTARWPRSSDWSQPELAEFYRVENALLQAGLRLETDRGVTDEGEPWFVFCHQETGEVFIHFARIDGHYIIDGAAHSGVARSRDFKALVRNLISGDLMTLPRPKPRGTNVFMHPAALLIALVGTAFFHSSKADAAEAHERGLVRRQGGTLNLFGSAASEKLPLGLDPVQTATVMAGVIIGLDPQRALPQALAAPVLRAEAPTTLYDLAIAGARDLAAPVSTAHAAQVHTGQEASADVHTAKIIMMSVLAASTPAHAGTALEGQGAISIPIAPPAAFVLAAAAAPDPSALVIANAGKPFLLGAIQTNNIPDDEAAAVVRAASNGDHHFLELNGKLPTVILNLIGHGEHITAAPPPSAPPAPAIADPTSVPTEVSSLSPAPTAGTATPPISSSGGTVPTTPPTTPPTPPAPPPVSHPSTPSGATTLPQHPHDLAIDRAVAAFMGEASHWEVVVSGHDLVIYDTQIFGRLPANTVLDSLTFTFTDGSSVSLVGTSNEITNLYHLGG